MPRLKQVPRDEAPDDIKAVYDMLFGGRDPVAEPGTATGIQYVSALFQARIDFRQDVVPEASVPPMALLHSSNQFVLLRFHQNRTQRENLHEWAG